MRQPAVQGERGVVGQRHFRTTLAHHRLLYNDTAKISLTRSNIRTDDELWSSVVGSILRY